MNCDTVKEIIASFDRIWECHSGAEGNLEITVPYVATNGDLMRVYVLQSKKDGYLVHDDQYIFESTEKANGRYDKHIFNDTKKHLEDYFAVTKRQNPDGSFTYLKSTKKKAALSATIFELAQFLSSVRSLLEISPGADQREEENFSSSVRTYLEEQLPQSALATRVQFRAAIPDAPVQLNFSIVGLNDAKSKYNAVQLITGNHERYFEGGICRANMMFSIARKWPLVDQTIAILNDSASGYNPSSLKLRTFLTELEGHTTQPPIYWEKQKERIAEVLH